MARTAIKALTVGGSTPTPVIGGTPKSVLYINSASQVAQDPANFAYDDTGKMIGLGTTAPTTTLTFAFDRTGVTYFNTADQVTNVEKVVMQWSGNVFNIIQSKLGTGVDRVIVVAAGGSSLQINGGGSSIARSTGSSAISVFTITGTMTNSGGISQGLQVTGNYSGQTSTAGWNAVLINPTDTGGGSGAKRILVLQLGGVDKAFFDNAGRLSFDSTIIAAGTTGAQTINKPAGQVNFAAAATTLVVTNSLVTVNSLVMVQVLGSDATMTSATVTKAAGSFTIRANSAATAETAVEFIVFN